MAQVDIGDIYARSAETPQSAQPFFRGKKKPSHKSVPLLFLCVRVISVSVRFVLVLGSGGGGDGGEGNGEPNFGVHASLA